jgi:hypothetical protein
MKNTFLILYLFLELTLFAQNPEFNLQKYWFYRERFKNFFVSIGTESGQGLAVPMMAQGENCDPNLVNSEVSDISVPDGEGTFRLDDLTGHQGWYIGVLATEYALLKEHDKNTDEIVYELYCALYALNRLDTYDPGNHLGNDDLDGFMLREDFPANFFELHPEIQAPVDEAIQDKWNVNRCTNHGGYSNGCFHALGTSEEEISKANYFGRYNEMAASTDHYCKILMGLALVVKYVDEFKSCITIVNNQIVFHEFQDGAIFIKQEAKNISDRIVSYLKEKDYVLMMPDIIKATSNIDPIYLTNNCEDLSNVWGSFPEPCRNCPIEPMIVPGGIPFFGIIAPRGCNPSWFSKSFARAAGAIRADFDIVQHPVKYRHYDNLVSLGSEPAWNFLATNTSVNLGSFLNFEGPNNKAGTVAYMFMLAAIGDSWPNTQANIILNDEIGYKWGFYHMLNEVLWDKESVNVCYTLERLNAAPCKGPDRNFFPFWNDNNSFEVDSYEAPSTGDNETKCNGLDYMLLHNLYLLTHPNYVQYNRVNIGDMYLGAEIPYVIPFPSCAPNYFTAVGTLSTGTSAILPDQLEYLCVGQINTNQKIRPKNLSGPYVGYDQCFLNSLVYINVNTSVDAVPFVTYKATNDVILTDGFEGLEGIEFIAKAIEFKCNATGDAYERLAGSLDSTSNDKVQGISLKNDNAKDLASKNNELPISQAENKTYNSKPIFNIYPNPNDGVFKVEYSNPNSDLTNINLVLYDILGNELFQKESAHTASKFLWDLNLADLKRGVYVIKLMNKQGVLETKRMVVK